MRPSQQAIPSVLVQVHDANQPRNHFPTRKWTHGTVVLFLNDDWTRGVCTWVMWRKWINTLYKQPEFEYNRSLTIITIKDIPQPNGTRLSNCILSTQFTSPNDANNYDKPLLFVGYERSAFHVAEYMIAEMPRFSDI